MINPFKEINWNPDAADIRKFARSLLIGFPVMGVVFFCLRWMKTGCIPEIKFFLMLGAIGAGAGLIFYILPVLGRPFYFVWYALACCVGLLMANLVFAIVFYMLFTPMGLVMRAIGRDALNLKWKKTETSHWIDMPPAPPASHYFRQF